MFCINTLTSDLGAFCIPTRQYLRVTHVIQVTPGVLTFWLQPISVFGCTASHGTSTKVHLHSPYHSILAPDRMTLAVPIPLTVPLNRVHCSQRFIPHPCRMVGRILEAELQVAHQIINVLTTRQMLFLTLNNNRILLTNNIYLCNIMSQITPATTGWVRWRHFCGFLQKW